MIRRSRRRSPIPTPEPLQLHVAMANRRRWQRRLSWASACACATSLLLWLLSVSLLVHLGGLVAAFGVGLALPVRSGVDWALQWIGKQGLSYPTAVELTQTADDPYGFHAAVAKRAGVQAARLEPPKPQPWWLPLLVSAVVLALLPVGPQARRGLYATPAGQDGARNAAQADAQTDTQGDDPAAAEPPATPQPDEGEQAATRDAAAAGNESELGSATGDGDGDAAAMSRFLETLRERPPSREPNDTNPFRGAAPAPGGATSGAEPSDATAQPPTEGARPPQGERSGQPGDGTGERSREEGGQNEPGAGDQGQGEQGAREQDEGKQGQEQSQGEQENAPGEQGQNEQSESGQDAEQRQSEQGQQGQGEQEDGTTGSGPQPQNEGGQGQGREGAPGDAGGNPEAGESGEGAGDAGGTPGRNADVLPTPNSDPEQLRGRLNNGPSNVAGTVRLPNTGQTPQPLGGYAPAGFSRAEERAITEGRIPVEYQDIIKNYFR